MALKSMSKENPSRRPMRNVSHKINIGPFTGPEDLALRTVHAQADNEQDSEEGPLIITAKKIQVMKSEKHQCQKLKWSREVETAPSLDTLSKTSQACVGRTLCYTDTSHWYSSPEHRARDNHPNVSTPLSGEEEYFRTGLLRNPTGQQSSNDTVVQDASKATYRSSERPMSRGGQTTAPAETILSEAIPLSITDELEKGSAKILVPRSPSSCLPPQTASETHHVLYHSEAHGHKPFSSPGIHTLDFTKALWPTTERDAARKRSVHSAIIRITQLMQEEHMVRGSKERKTVDRSFCFEKDLCSTLKPKTQCTRKGNVPVLISNRATALCSDMNTFSKQYYSLSSSQNVSDIVSKVLCSRQSGISVSSVGFILNGMNTKYPLNITMYSQCLRKLSSNMAKNARCKCQASSIPYSKQKTCQEQKMDFLLISKPPKSTRNDLLASNCTKGKGVLWSSA